MLYKYSESFILHVSQANVGDDFDYSKVKTFSDIPLDRLKNIHGHNYLITLSAYSHYLDKGVVVRSEDIESIRANWDWKNLNLHPSLLNMWASTEATAEAILNEFISKCGKHVFKASISLNETPDINISIIKRVNHV